MQANTLIKSKKTIGSKELSIPNLSTNLLEPMKTMFIVGNGNISNDMSAIIDTSDLVVRFNWMNNCNVSTGTKTNIWVLTSNNLIINQHINGPQTVGGDNNLSVKEMIRLSNSLFFSIPPFSPTQRNEQKKILNHIINEDRKARIEAVSRFLEHFDANDHPFRIIEFPDKYVFDLAPNLWSPKWTCPSNGYLITRMLIDDLTFFKYKKYLVGFTWEGWDGHPWLLERLYLEKLERENLITIVK